MVRTYENTKIVFTYSSASSCRENIGKSSMYIFLHTKSPFNSSKGDEIVSRWSLSLSN